MSKKVIYTAIMGEYDLLKEPLVITPGWDYICYTNNKDLVSDIWKFEYMHLNSVKELRKLKILTPFEYETCIWVDASIEINCNLDEFIIEHHKGYFTIMKHPYRNCVYEEANECIKRKKDSMDIINEQIGRYKQMGYPVNNGMVASGLIVRESCIRVQRFCDRWWKEVEQYSKRDQISFNFTAFYYPLRYNLIPYSVLEKEFILYLHHNSFIP